MTSDCHPGLMMFNPIGIIAFYFVKGRNEDLHLPIFYILVWRLERNGLCPEAGSDSLYERLDDDFRKEMKRCSADNVPSSGTFHRINTGLLTSDSNGASWNQFSGNGMSGAGYFIVHSA